MQSSVIRVSCGWGARNFHRLHGLRQGLAQLGGFEAEGAGAALVGHVARGVDHIQSIRPRSVGLFGGVAKFVEHCGRLDSELADARSRDEGSVFFALRAGEDNIVFYVALHLPDVAGMRLSDVDDEELDLIVVLVKELI